MIFYATGTVLAAASLIFNSMPALVLGLFVMIIAMLDDVAKGKQ